MNWGAAAKRCLGRDRGTRETWRFPDEGPIKADLAKYTPRQITAAWMPWILLTVFVFVWGLPDFKDLLAPTVITLPVPGLHRDRLRAQVLSCDPSARW